jgi:uncharacterized membrane protein YeiH
VTAPPALGGDLTTVFGVMNAVGLVAFALVGSLKAIDENLDVLGVAVLGYLTALGGGTVRDTMVNRVPTVLSSTTDVWFAASGVALAVLLSGRIDERNLLDRAVVTVPDAVGLAAFAATGAIVGADAGVSAFGVVVLGTLTGVGGGTLTDVLLDRVPFVLYEDFYATCAVAGCVAFLAARGVGLNAQVAGLACAVVAFAFRLVALRFELELPTAP